MATDDDTVVRRVLSLDEVADGQRRAALAGIVAAVDVLGEISASLQARHPQVWHGAEWQKELRDLETAGDQLRKHIESLRTFAEGG